MTLHTDVVASGIRLERADTRSPPPRPSPASSPTPRLLVRGSRSAASRRDDHHQHPNYADQGAKQVVAVWHELVHQDATGESQGDEDAAVGCVGPTELGDGLPTKTSAAGSSGSRPPCRYRRPAGDQYGGIAWNRANCTVADRELAISGWRTGSGTTRSPERFFDRLVQGHLPAISPRRLEGLHVEQVAQRRKLPLVECLAQQLLDGGARHLGPGLGFVLRAANQPVASSICSPSCRLGSSRECDLSATRLLLWSPNPAVGSPRARFLPPP